MSASGRSFSLLVLFAAGVAAGPRSDMLVSTDWLAAHTNDRQLVILHAAPEEHFAAGRIPGACWIPWSKLVTVRDGVENELPPASELAGLFSQCGVTGESRIVIYGDSLLHAARAWFTLDYLGHGDRAALLDGGLLKWRAEQRPISTERASPQPVVFRPVIQPAAIIALEQVRDLSYAAVASGPETLLLDVREPAEYSNGHIPGAIGLPWTDALADKKLQTLRPLADLRKVYQDAGIVPGRAVVVYCATGVRASHAYFALKYLGYDVSLYDGSFNQWSRAKDAAIAR